MANPAPTINQINAFNATQGTTIDFNIIGGTELVRSNRIYIYDLSDNSLICTHLYVSTESIHELPPNTDSSIVYESGKSSADFVNGAQYYAQIQTYTDTAGTQGGSGLSVAKMFWCLVDPTLTITAIPSTISTTSYNVSATYTDTSASVVSNIIQQYQFNLYSAVGSLLQSSGVVVGSGTQQGTSDVYDISYNFTGLNVGSSYYVTVEVTTTQGMSVSAQSNTFTVSIDTPTLGEATVVNNACDGYISVTSNLSGEYGGSASGEIASFVTSSINDISSLKVNLDPVQDLHGYDSPWVGGSHYNQWDEDWESGALDNNGTPMADALSIRAKNFIPVTPNTSYYIKTSGTCYMRYFDADKNIIGKTDKNGSGNVNGNDRVRVTHDNCYYIKFYVNETTYNHDIAINYPSTVTTYSPWENLCPIYGHDSVEAKVSGVNVWDEEWEVGGINTSGQETSTSGYYRSKNYTEVKPSTTYYMKNPVTMSVMFYDSSKGFIDWTTASNSTITTPSNCHYLRFRNTTANSWTPYNNDISINYPSTDHDYHAYNGTTYPVSWQTEAGTVYGGTVDLVTGELVVDRAMVTYDGSADENWRSERSGNWQGVNFYTPLPTGMTRSTNGVILNITDKVSVSYIQDGLFISASYLNFLIGQALGITDVAVFRTWLSNNPIQLSYPLATPQTIQLTPQEIQTLLGTNNVWSEDGEVEITYNIPITNLLVKRQDVADVSGTWLTLYSQPVTQASDMDFTFIDFLNQYGKTYKYALVPLLTQTQSGVEVEVEGGYTVSDEVQSVFDGVFIADSTGSQKCKANVGYGNVDMNQAVGTITPIGAQYPVVITNSKNQYHNGSISGTIVPDDYYFNGNLSRIDMVNKRNELEKFLTNKRAKIIKDWNSNIWLVMITDNIGCNFNNNYGMGMVNFNANWVEVGDPTNQQDLQATGLINVGGV